MGVSARCPRGPGVLLVAPAEASPCRSWWCSWAWVCVAAGAAGLPAVLGVCSFYPVEYVYVHMGFMQKLGDTLTL